jgi:ABC-type sugar transport system ATPase subunit
VAEVIHTVQLEGMEDRRPGQLRELYECPASAFVAGFIGTWNLITLRIDTRDDWCLVNGPG